ncbi:MAG: DNA lyase [Candidatus Aenigmarchaeota archaeon]|nr:DNA lyase [Candidatus Aenigmarchaeota archaeon]
MLDNIRDTYSIEKSRIKGFLDSRRHVISDKNKVFFELMFCIAVPQSKAPICRTRLEELAKTGKLHTANEKELSMLLKGIRFPNNKAGFIITARTVFDNIYTRINTDSAANNSSLRTWLAANVKGIGMKEASHFLRNIGLGEELAILDIHILRTMKELGLIDNMKLTPKRYIEYEKIFQKYAQQLGLKPAELDISIWLMKSGNREIM